MTAGYGGRNGKVSGAGTVRPVRAPCQIVSPSCPRLKVTVKACKYCSCYTWRAGSAFEVAGCGRLSWLSRSANGPCACLALWRSFWWCLPEGAESPSKESLCMDGKTQFLACADFCFLGAVPAGTPDACSSVCVHWTRIALIISDSDRQSLLQSITNLTVQLQHWHLGWVMLFIGITELLIMPKSVRLSFWSGAKTPAHFTHPRHHWNFIFNFLASQMQTLWWVRRPWPMRSLRTILVCIRYWDIVHYLLMCSALALFGQINLWSLFTMWRGGTGMSSEFTVFWILLTATRLPLPVIQLAWNTWSESLMTSLCCRLPNSTVTCRFDMPRHTVNFQYVKHVPKKHVCRHWAATILFF